MISTETFPCVQLTWAKQGWAGYWSRRLDREHRVVYVVLNGSLVVAQCRYNF